MRARLLKLHRKTLGKLLRLKREAEVDGEYRVARRIHAIVLNSDGKSSGEIATVLKSPRSKVSEWLRCYSEHSFEGLLEGYRSGRPSGLNEKQRAELGDIIESGPVSYGFLSGIWTSPMIAKVIEGEFSVSYHPGHVRKILHEMNFSVQRPKKLLAKADPAKQNRWRRYTYPSIKKRASPRAPH